MFFSFFIWYTIPAFMSTSEVSENKLGKQISAFPFSLPPYKTKGVGRSVCQVEALDSFCTMLDTTVLDFTLLDTSCTIPDRVAKSPKSQTRKIWARPGVVKLSTQKLFPSLELCLAPLLVSFLSLPLQNNLLLNDQI